METWKCRKCNHFNTTTAEEKKKAKRDYAIANTALTIVSGGMWFLILLIKDCFLFSFDRALLHKSAIGQGIPNPK